MKEVLFASAEGEPSPRADDDDEPIDTQRSPRDRAVDPEGQVPRRGPRRRLVGVLLALAAVMLLVGVFALWVQRQALDTDNWTNTSSALLADPKVEQAVGDYLVRELSSGAPAQAPPSGCGQSYPFRTNPSGLVVGYRWRCGPL